MKRLPVLITMLAALGIATPAAAGTITTALSATYQGNFTITGQPGSSDAVFLVEETLDGSDVTLGDFTLASELTQNLANVPEGCIPPSSSGAAGHAVARFDDGELLLHRVAATACFDFPLVEIAEDWVVAGGTGAYTGTTGRLARTGTGDAA